MHDRRVIDLTMTLSDGMMRYPSPSHTDIRIEQIAEISVAGRSTTRIQLGSHAGTHIDAPCHFLGDACGVDELPLDILVGPAVVLDLTPVVSHENLTRERLVAAWPEMSADRVIIRTDWWKMWGSLRYYEESPFLSADAIDLLLENGVRLLALDIPSPDAVPRSGGPDSPNHKVLMGAGVIIVEYLTNTSALSGGPVDLVALPLKLAGADGSPARCIAIEWEQDE